MKCFPRTDVGVQTRQMRERKGNPLLAAALDVLGIELIPSIQWGPCTLIAPANPLAAGISADHIHKQQASVKKGAGLDGLGWPLGKVSKPRVFTVLEREGNRGPVKDDQAVEGTKQAHADVTQRN